MKKIVEKDGQSLLFAIAPPPAPKPEPLPKAPAAAKVAANQKQGIKPGKRKTDVANRSTPVKSVEPAPIEVKPWAEAEVQISAVLIPVNDSQGGRQVVFTIKTDGLPPLVKLRHIPELASLSDMEEAWAGPIAELIDGYREQVAQEVTKRSSKAEAVNTDTEVSPEPTTTEAMEPIAEAEAEAEPVEAAEDNPTQGETDGEDQDA